MREALFSRMEKQFRKPLYKILMTVLGLPTFIVGAICYFIYMRKEQAEREQFRKEAIDQLEKEKVFADIEVECKSLLDQKFKFFGKNKNSREYETSLRKQIEAEKKLAIENRTIQLLREANLSRPMKFMAFLTSKLNNPLLLVL